LIADYLRNKAITAGKLPNSEGTKKGEVIHAYWTNVCELLEETSKEVSQWFTISLTYDLADTSSAASLSLLVLPDYHHAVQLHETLENLQITIANAKMEKDRALSYLSRRLELLEKKLSPMLRERDDVKKITGCK